MKDQHKSSGEPESQKSLVQQRFGQQAQAYSTSSILSNRENLDAIVRMAEISAHDHILDVATGTGFLAAAFCDMGAQVLATDLTASMLAQAQIIVGQRDSAAFALADVEALPFSDASFDGVSCRVAFHHFTHPLVALGEMARVCRPEGRVILMDVIASENPAKSEYQNRMEVIRDPSHVKHYSRAEFARMLEECGLGMEKAEEWRYTWAFDEWIAVAGADDVATAQIKALMLDAIDGDKAALQPELRDDRLFFTYTTLIIIAQKRMP